MNGVERFDEEDEPNPELNLITNAIIGAAIAVHKELGPGHLESTYEKALAIEFGVRRVEFERQFVVPIIYRGVEVGETRLDFVVEQQVVVELKAVETLAPIHTAQAISYLRASGKRLAIMINFNVRVLREGVKRIAL